MKFSVMIGVLFILIPFNFFGANVYWIGTTFQWEDKNNWSLSSGGPSCSCNPGIMDDVIIESSVGNSMILIADGTQAAVRSIEIGSTKHLFIGGLDIEVARLEISNAVNMGLDISGKITIRDSMTITNAGTAAIQVNTMGEMTLKLGSTVYLSGNSTENGIFNDGQITLEGDCISKSNLTIERILEKGIDGSGILVNNGSIQINDIDPLVSGFAVGLNVGTTGVLVNDTCGLIKIDSIDFEAGLSPGIESAGRIINRGSIDITNVNGSGVLNIGNDTTFNHGSMTVSNFGGSAFGTTNNGTIVNQGSIEGFNNVKPNAYGISNDGDFINESTGIINLHDLDGFEVIDNTSNFLNSGSLNISNVVGDVIRHILVGATFYSDGQITINNYSETGLNVRFDFEIALGSTFEINPN